MSILAALQTAARMGLAGVRPRGFEAADLCETYVPDRSRLLLGAELPGPHAVTVAPDGCWVSWGEHYDPACWPGAATEEAWLIEWEV